MDLYVILIYFAGIALHSSKYVNCVDPILPQNAADRPKTCEMERSFKMMGYYCANMNYKEVPQHLKSSLEVS